MCMIAIPLLHQDNTNVLCKSLLENGNSKNKSMAEFSTMLDV